MTIKSWVSKQANEIREKFETVMKCIWSGQHPTADEGADSTESLATRDYSASGYSSRAGETGTKVDDSNIEEAESSLRESGHLNYEEARALLGRLEYQKGNIEASLHVFEGIDLAAVTSKIKISLARRRGHFGRTSQSEFVATMSMHAISLLLEAIFLKAKSLQYLGRLEDAAHSCRLILDTVESTLPEGLPQKVSADFKIREILNKAVELLPELFKLAGSSQDAILSYRRALLYNWNLDPETKAKIQKEFAIFLLYCGMDAKPPNLRSQMDGSFVPRSNIEEAILLLLILLRKLALRKIEWDASIMDHLCYALSVSNELMVLANQLENLHPGFIERWEIYSFLALCYYGEGEDLVALNLLRNLVNNRENNQDCMLELLLCSKICGKNEIHIEEGLVCTQRAISELDGKCSQLLSVAICLNGVLFSAHSRSMASDSERLLKRSQALEAFESAERMMRDKDSSVIYHLCLENAEQRKLDTALFYAKQLLKLEGGSSVRAYVILARILSAQKRYVESEAVIDAALDQTGKWEHAELLRTKARIQTASAELKGAIGTYTRLLAVLQVRSKSFATGKNFPRGKSNHNRSLEMETWHDLANVYVRLSRWSDAEACLSKSKAINPHSANRWHSTGLVKEFQGRFREALASYRNALDIDPTHVMSLISTTRVLRKLGSESWPILRSFLTDAIRLDWTNYDAWYWLGLVYEADPTASTSHAAECFEAAAILQETAPIEPFR